MGSDYSIRRRLLSRVRLAFVSLVAASAGLIAVYAEGSVSDILFAIAGGIVVGFVLVWIAFPQLDTLDSARSRRR